MGFSNCRYNTSKIADYLGVSKAEVEEAMKQAQVGGYAKIWEIEDKGNYSTAQVSTSRKNKETGQYDTDFQFNFVRLVGSAHELAKKLSVPSNGLSISISSCDVSRRWDREKQREYTNFTIFGFEVQEGDGQNRRSASKSKPQQRKTPKRDSYDGGYDDSDFGYNNDLPFN